MKKLIETLLKYFPLVEDSLHRRKLEFGIVGERPFIDM